jgi:hypothetical protein
MNALGDKWMAKELYEICPLCDGTGAILTPGLLARTSKLEKREDGRYVCVGCGGTKYIKIGMTVGQLERMHAKADKFDQMERIKAQASKRCPGVPDDFGTR